MASFPVVYSISMTVKICHSGSIVFSPSSFSGKVYLYASTSPSRTAALIITYQIIAIIAVLIITNIMLVDIRFIRCLLLNI